MAGFVDYSHPALPETQIELIPAIEHSIPRDGRYKLLTVSGTVVELIREAMSTSLTLFHLLAWSNWGLAIPGAGGTRQRRPGPPLTETIFVPESVRIVLAPYFKQSARPPRKLIT